MTGMEITPKPLPETERVEILAKLPRATNNNGPYLQYDSAVAQVYDIAQADAKFKIELFDAKSGVSTRIYLDATGGLIGDAARGFPDNNRPIPAYPPLAQGDVDRMLRSLHGQTPMSDRAYNRLMGIPEAAPADLHREFQEWWRMR